MKTTVIKVSGMSCMHCSSRVQKALEALDGVTSVKVELESGLATVSGDFDDGAAVKAIEDAGYDAAL